VNKMSFYVTDGPLATTMSEVQEDYFRECLAAGAGGVQVVLRDGSTDLITGSRYLEPGTAAARKSATANFRSFTWARRSRHMATGPSTSTSRPATTPQGA
jgi:hypothetical protein